VRRRHGDARHGREQVLRPVTRRGPCSKRIAILVFDSSPALLPCTGGCSELMRAAVFLRILPCNKALVQRVVALRQIAPKQYLRVAPGVKDPTLLYRRRSYSSPRGLRIQMTA